MTVLYCIGLICFIFAEISLSDRKYTPDMTKDRRFPAAVPVCIYKNNGVSRSKGWVFALPLPAVIL